MKTADLVKRLLEAGANPEAVAIAITAVEEAAEEARPRRRRRKPAEVVRAVK
jgi:hypothetical protein